jgi:hypothetical protein
MCLDGRKQLGGLPRVNSFCLETTSRNSTNIRIPNLNCLGLVMSTIRYVIATTLTLSQEPVNKKSRSPSLYNCKKVTGPSCPLNIFCVLPVYIRRHQTRIVVSETLPTVSDVFLATLPLSAVHTSSPRTCRKSTPVGSFIGFPKCFVRPALRSRAYSITSR